MDSIAELIENTFSDRNVEVVRLRGKFKLKAFTTSIYLLLADAVILSCYPVILSIYRVFFFTGPPPKKLKYRKPRLGEVRCI